MLFPVKRNASNHTVWIDLSCYCDYYLKMSDKFGDHMERGTNSEEIP
jgi:hypothetical protein